MLKKQIIFLIVFFSFLTIAFMTIQYLNEPYEINKDLSNLDLSNVKKLMIVAHPDDEMLWGGAHLLEDNYLVVCITCGTKRIRAHEFIKTMKNTNDKYIMLGYPDKTNGKRDDWSTYDEYILRDLETIIDSNNWELIVTHNPDGEYGHIHHKLTSKMVTFLVPDNTLYYFGKYFSKKSYDKLTDKPPKINSIVLEKKVKILSKNYKSQKFIKSAFDQMFSHEDWINAKNWN